MPIAIPELIKPADQCPDHYEYYDQHHKCRHRLRLPWEGKAGARSSDSDTNTM